MNEKRAVLGFAPIVGGDVLLVPNTLVAFGREGAAANGVEGAPENSAAPGEGAGAAEPAATVRDEAGDDDRAAVAAADATGDASLEAKLKHVLKYRPDQPRVPAGRPDGGQWTTEGGGAATNEGSPDTPSPSGLKPLLGSAHISLGPDVPGEDALPKIEIAGDDRTRSDAPGYELPNRGHNGPPELLPEEDPPISRDWAAMRALQTVAAIVGAAVSAATFGVLAGTTTEAQDPTLDDWRRGLRFKLSGPICTIDDPQGKIPPGSFVITDWSGYPEGVPQPTGPFRLLNKYEYMAARETADMFNKKLHEGNPAALQGYHIHDIHPVKFGGKAADIDNKIAIEPAHHYEFNAWWMRIQRYVEALRGR